MCPGLGLNEVKLIAENIGENLKYRLIYDLLIGKIWQTASQTDR